MFKDIIDTMMAVYGCMVPMVMIFSLAAAKRSIHLIDEALMFYELFPYGYIVVG
jgi:hypothetical protein